MYTLFHAYNALYYMLMLYVIERACDVVRAYIFFLLLGSDLLLLQVILVFIKLY